MIEKPGILALVVLGVSIAFFIVTVSVGTVVTVSHNDSDVADQPELNFLDSTTTEWTITNDPNNERNNLTLRLPLDQQLPDSQDVCSLGYPLVATTTGSGFRYVCDDGLVVDGLLSNSFEKIAVNGQDNVIADGSQDTLTYTYGLPLTATSTTSTDSIAVGWYSEQVTSTTWCVVACQWDFDSALTMIATGSITLTGTVAATDVTAGGSSLYSFTTVDVPAGDDPVADAYTDTLTITEAAGIDIAGTGDSIAITFDSTEVGSTTWGSGAPITWTFDAGATDPTIDVTTGVFEVNSELHVNDTGGQTSPSLAFVKGGDSPPSGVYRAAADTLAITTAGTQAITFDGNSVDIKNNRVLLIEEGTTSTPGIAFLGDTNTGMFQRTGNEGRINFAANATVIADIDSAGLDVVSGALMEGGVGVVTETGAETLTGKELDTTTVVNSFSFEGIVGADYNPGSDIDTDIVTVGVTGSPRLYWDESQNTFVTSVGFGYGGTTKHGSGIDMVLDSASIVLDTDNDTSIRAGADDTITLELGGTDVYTITATGLTVGQTNGIDYNPGSDIDAVLITVGVTGAPIMFWDESINNFRTNVGLYTGSNLTVEGNIDVLTTGNRIDFDTDNDTSIRAAVDDNLAFEIGGSDRLMLTSDGLDMVAIDNHIDFDADNDTSIRASADDVLTIEVGGVDAFAFITGILDLVLTGTRIDLDTDNDTSIRADADDSIAFELGGVDYYTFTPTTLDVAGANITNIGTISAGAENLGVDIAEDADGWHGRGGSASERTLSITGTGVILDQGLGTTSTPAFSSSTIANTRYERYGAPTLHPDVDTVVGGASSFGGLIQAATAGHLAIGIRPNGTDDSINLISWDGVGGTTYTQNLLKAEADGDIIIGGGPITFTNSTIDLDTDRDTYITSPSDDTLELWAGGVKAFHVNNSGDIVCNGTCAVTNASGDVQLSPANQTHVQSQLRHESYVISGVVEHDNMNDMTTTTVLTITTTNEAGSMDAGVYTFNFTLMAQHDIDGVADSEGSMRSYVGMFGRAQKGDGVGVLTPLVEIATTGNAVPNPTQRTIPFLYVSIEESTEYVTNLNVTCDLDDPTAPSGNGKCDATIFFELMYQTYSTPPAVDAA